MAEVAAPDPLFPGLAPKADVPDGGPVLRGHRGDVAGGARRGGRRADRTSARLGSSPPARSRPRPPSSASRTPRGSSAGRRRRGVAHHGDDRRRAAAAGSPRRSRASADVDRPGGDRAQRAADKAVAQPATRRRSTPAPTPSSWSRSAVATLVGFLAYVGFGGRRYIEGRSCFSGKAGQQVAAPSISIWDDGADPRTLGAPFDFEGVPRRTRGPDQGRRVPRRRLRPAHRQAGGRPSTGHGLPAPNPEGPFPLNLFMGDRRRLRRGHDQRRRERGRARDALPLLEHREPDRVHASPA